MRILTAILIIVLIVVCLLFISLHIFVNIKGEALLIEKLEGVFEREVSIGGLSTSFPANVHVKNIEVRGLFTVDKVYARGGVFDIFSKTFNLSVLKVTRPVVTIEKSFIESTTASFGSKEGDTQEAPVIKKQEEATAAKPPADIDPMAVSRGRFLSPEFVLKRLIVNDGTIYFIDKEVSKKGLVIKVQDVNMQASNINLGSKGSPRTSFDLEGKIVWSQANEGQINLKGWIEYFKKNMDAELTLSNMDYLAFSDYYPPFWKPDSLGLKEALLSLESKIDSKNNDMFIDCFLSVDKIKFIEVTEEENEVLSSRIKTMKTMIALFPKVKGKPTLHFGLKTKMDSPQFNLSSLQASFQENVSFGPQMLLDTIFGKVKSGISKTGVTDTAEDVKEITVDKAIDTIKGIGKKFKEMFNPKD